MTNETNINDNSFLDDSRTEDEKDAEQILNETETEPFTIEERTDLNLTKCVRGQK